MCFLLLVSLTDSLLFHIVRLQHKRETWIRPLAEDPLGFFFLKKITIGKMSVADRNFVLLWAWSSQMPLPLLDLLPYVTKYPVRIRRFS